MEAAKSDAPEAPEAPASPPAPEAPAPQPTPEAAAPQPAEHAHHGPTTGRELAVASLGALGVVYGDIGTSPLYAIKECLAWDPAGKLSPHAVPPTFGNVAGVLSLMFWALVLVV